MTRAPLAFRTNSGRGGEHRTMRSRAAASRQKHERASVVRRVAQWTTSDTSPCLGDRRSGEVAKPRSLASVAHLDVSRFERWGRETVVLASEKLVELLSPEACP